MVSWFLAWTLFFTMCRWTTLLIHPHPSILSIHTSIHLRTPPSTHPSVNPYATGEPHMPCIWIHPISPKAESSPPITGRLYLHVQEQWNTMYPQVIVTRYDWHAAPLGLVAVHEVRHARGGGSPRRCDSLWQSEGSRACDVTLTNFLSYIWNMKFQVMF